MKEEALTTKLKRFESDTKWIIEHYDELKIEYPDEWVASFNNKVIGHDKDLANLMEKLRAKYQADAGHIAVEFVAPRKVELIPSLLGRDLLDKFALIVDKPRDMVLITDEEVRVQQTYSHLQATFY